jgi:hypothetical protein
VNELKWIAVANIPGRKQLPEWQRSAAIDADGAVYAPAVLAGNERAVFLCAAYDGVSAVTDGGHVFLPTSWLRREYPCIAETCDKIEQKVRLHVQPQAV